jgi:hypothetical protein
MYRIIYPKWYLVLISKLANFLMRGFKRVNILVQIIGPFKQGFQCRISNQVDPGILCIGAYFYVRLIFLMISNKYCDLSLLHYAL